MATARNDAIALARRYVRHLRKHGIRVEQAYLYGSHANGRPRKDSDLDIVIVSRQFTHSRYDDSVRIAKLRREIDLRISPLAYHPRDFTHDNLIPHEAMTRGIRIA